MNSNLLVACVLGFAWSCQSSQSSASPEEVAAAMQSKNEYGRATSAGDLIVLFVRDADAKDWSTVVEGLDSFMRQCVLTDHDAWGHAVFQELKPVWRMQSGGGYKYVTAVQNIADVLRIGADRSVAKDRASWNRGNLDPLREAAADDRSYMAPGIQKQLSDPLAADFLIAMLAVQDSVAKKGADQQAATAVATRCEQLASSFDSHGRTKDALLLRVAGAQVLDAAGLEEQAMDRWLEVSSSPALGQADAVLQVAVARRVRAFRDRLRDELASSIRKEEEARADALVAEAKVEAARLTDEQRTQVANLERDMNELTTRSKIEKEAAVTEQRTLSAETIERQTKRISELEQHLVDIATLRAKSPVQIDWNQANFGPGPSSPPADVLGQWQKSQAGTPEPVAKETKQP